MMRLLSCCLLLGASLVSADKPAVAPKYEPAAQESQASPVYSAPQAAPAPDTYGAPAAEPVANNDEYGAPQAQPIAQDSYGAPQAQPIGKRET